MTFILKRKNIALNSLINLTGNVLPLAVGLITIPLMVHGFGVERFGILALAWAIIGYFSLFDLGIGRAMTQLIAEKIGESKENEVPKLAWTGLLLMLIFAVSGATITATLSPWFVSTVLNMNGALAKESVWAFIMLSMAIPAVVLSSGFAGMLAATQRFGLINALRVPMGVMIFLVPLAFLPYSKNMIYVCAGLLAVRILFLVLHVAICLYVFPLMRARLVIEQTEIKHLLSFGGWMTVTNIIGPLMIYVDRFAIGALVSISAVAFYVTPYEMVTRLWAFPAAIVAVLFPAFAQSKSHPNNANELYSFGGRTILVSLAPVVLIFVTFASEGINAWLGGKFPHESATVLKWLIVGVYINSYAQVPFAFIQGRGRADITAKLHIIELPIYLILIFWLLSTMGIIGAALAFTIRITIDSVLLTWMAQKIENEIHFSNRQMFPMILTALPLFFIGMVIESIDVKLIFIAIGLLILFIVSYFHVIMPEEKQMLWNFFQRYVRAKN